METEGPAPCTSNPAPENMDVADHAATGESVDIEQACPRDSCVAKPETSDSATIPASTKPSQDSSAINGTQKHSGDISVGKTNPMDQNQTDKDCSVTYTIDSKDTENTHMPDPTLATKEIFEKRKSTSTDVVASDIKASAGKTTSSEKALDISEKTAGRKRDEAAEVLETPLVPQEGLRKGSSPPNVTPGTKPLNPAPSVHPEPETSPVTQGTTPVTQGTTPVTQGTTPVTQGTTPVTQGTTPVTQGTTPVTQGTTPVTQGTTPVTQGTTPVTQGTTPVTQGTTPVTKETTPVTRGTTPVTLASSPVTLVSSSGVQQLFSAYRDLSDEDMTSDTSDDSSSSSSDSETDIVGVESSESEEDEERKSKNQNDATQRKEQTTFLKTKGEIGVEDLPPIETLQITLDARTSVLEVGQVSSVVGTLVIIESNLGSPALDLDSILFLEGRVSVGQIFETFGPVVRPYYSVRFNTQEEITEKGITVGSKIYFAPKTPKFTQYVFLTQLQQMKGSDASWENNNEPPERYLDYSDDEQERQAKARARGKDTKDTGDATDGHQLPGAVNPRNRRNKRKITGQQQSYGRAGHAQYRPQHGQNPFGKTPHVPGVPGGMPGLPGLPRGMVPHYPGGLPAGLPAGVPPPGVSGMEGQTWGGYPLHQGTPRFGEIPQYHSPSPSPVPSPQVSLYSPFVPLPAHAQHHVGGHVTGQLTNPMMPMIDSRFVQNQVQQFAPQPNPDSPLI